MQERFQTLADLTFAQKFVPDNGSHKVVRSIGKERRNDGQINIVNI